MLDRVNLPLAKDEARCEPIAGPCLMGAKFARRIATIQRGSPIGDFSLTDLGGTALCKHLILASTVRKEAAAPVAPRVHPPMGGRP